MIMHHTRVDEQPTVPDVSVHERAGWLESTLYALAEGRSSWTPAEALAAYRKAYGPTLRERRDA